jgi:hypothetical protein
MEADGAGRVRAGRGRQHLGCQQISALAVQSVQRQSQQGIGLGIRGSLELHT